MDTKALNIVRSVLLLIDSQDIFSRLATFTKPLFPKGAPLVAKNEQTVIAIDKIITAPLKPQLSQSCNECYAAKHC